LPARLNAKKLNTGGNVEILLLRRNSPNVWETLVNPEDGLKMGQNWN